MQSALVILTANIRTITLITAFVIFSPFASIRAATETPDSLLSIQTATVAVKRGVLHSDIVYPGWVISKNGETGIVMTALRHTSLNDKRFKPVTVYLYPGTSHEIPLRTKLTAQSSDFSFFQITHPSIPEPINITMNPCGPGTVLYLATIEKAIHGNAIPPAVISPLGIATKTSSDSSRPQIHLEKTIKSDLPKGLIYSASGQLLGFTENINQAITLKSYFIPKNRILAGPPHLKPSEKPGIGVAEVKIFNPLHDVTAVKLLIGYCKVLTIHASSSNKNKGYPKIRGSIKEYMLQVNGQFATGTFRVPVIKNHKSGYSLYTQIQYKRANTISAYTKPQHYSLSGSGTKMMPTQADWETNFPLMPQRFSYSACMPEDVDLIKTELQLPGQVYKAETGVGGKYIALCYKDKPDIDIFEISSFNIIGSIPPQHSSFYIAAGADALYIYYPEYFILENWNMQNQTKRSTTVVPVASRMSGIYMGANTYSPIIFRKRYLGYLDPFQNRIYHPRNDGRIKIVADNNSNIIPGSTTLNAGVTNSGNSHAKEYTVCIDPADVYGYKTERSARFIWPGPYNRYIYTYTGQHTVRYEQPPSLTASDKMPEGIYFPAVSGNIFGYLNQHKNDPSTAAVDIYYIEAPQTRLFSLPVQETEDDFLPTMNRLSLNLNERIFLLPGFNRLCFIRKNNTIVSYPCSLKENLEDRQGSYLIIDSIPPATADYNSTYRYQMHTLTNQPFVQFSLPHCPHGSSVSEDGLLTWEVPEEYALPYAYFEVEATAGAAKTTQGFHISLTASSQAKTEK